MPDNRRWVLEHEKRFSQDPYFTRTWHYFHEDYKPAICGHPPIPGTPRVGEEPYLLAGQSIHLCEKCYLERMKQLEKKPRSLQDFVTEVMDWAKTKGWEPDDKRTFGDECTLLHTEISEAFEAWRKRGFEAWTETDKNGIEKPEGVPSEFADLFIRLCHYCGAHNIDLEEWFDRKMAYNQKREYRHGGKRA